MQWVERQAYVHVFDEARQGAEDQAADEEKRLRVADTERGRIGEGWRITRV